METNAPESSEALKQSQCQYLWEEYKYRHDLIWQRIFISTTAVVLVSLIPYAQKDITRLLGFWILIAPSLATLLSIFVWCVISDELGIFERIKIQYRRQQTNLLDEDLKYRPEDLEYPPGKRMRFDRSVLLYLGALGILSAINGLIVWCIWIPRLLEQPLCPSPRCS